MMNFPENLKKGDTIGICAPSGGIAEEDKQQKLDIAIQTLQQMGYKVIETKSVRKEEKGRSASAKQRAKELMELWENDAVKLIIFAAGGDYLCEIFDYLDLEKIRKLKPKWMQGFSDITGLEFLWNTVLEIPSIYCDTIKSYAMQPLYPNLIDALDIATGKMNRQTSFEKCEKSYNVRQLEDTTEREETQDIREGYQLTEPVKWVNIKGENKIEMEGRMLGGCLDCVQRFFGTEYDHICSYIEKYKQDGIIWYLETFEMNSPELTRILWQMKHAGYFKHVTGIIFGRPYMFREDYHITFQEAVTEILSDLNIPVICDADIGHVAPQMAIVNGAITKITSENGSGTICPQWDKKN